MPINIEAAYRLREHKPEDTQSKQLREQKKNATPEQKADINLKLDRIKTNKDQAKKSKLVNKMNKQG